MLTGGRSGGRRPRLLAVIAVFRLLKALVLIAVALGALRLIDHEAASRAQEWLAALPFVARHPGVERAASKVTGATAAHLEIAASVGLAYALLFAVEGVGLWLQRVWAEYLTIVATTSFVPFEVYELTRRFTPIRLGALVVNVAIVGYLAVRRWHARRGHGHVAGLIVLAVLGVGLTSCGHECPALPCALPIAITISVTKAAAGGPVEGATVEVTGATTASLPCTALCRVPGTAGTYNLDVTAPGCAPVRRTVVVEGTMPPCGCPTVVSQSVTIVLASASSSLRDW